jgi:hypothetical protein
MSVALEHADVKVPLISIKIDHRRAPGSGQSLPGAWSPHLPGELLEGEYQIDAVEPQEVSAVELSVLWYTEGKGDEDLGIHHFERRTSDDNGEEQSNLTELRRFSVRLPASPLSYEGVLVKLRWRVRVRVFLNSGRDYFADLPFRMGAVPDAHAVPPIATIGDAHLEMAEATNGAARGESE